MAVVGRRKLQLVDKYVGERKNQLRHGYGVYLYENKFFRYEGQWENGLKHGHGKLILGDGGYYEGTFVRGEMDGHGYRVFGLSRSTYTGQFHRGQMHGQGLFRTASGAQYEGTWVHGKKEGSGIHTEPDGGVYEGEFHDNKKHGEGVQIYANGDQYDGDWVAGKRHGHGMLRCSNGTIYDGQWRGDVYHGEGSILHASGVTYKGMWVNGRPASEPVELRLVGSDNITVEQGRVFDVNFCCVDSKEQVVALESGRSFMVTAAIRKVSTPKTPRARSRMLTIPAAGKEEKKRKLIETPLGYPAAPYELLQVPQYNSSNPETPALSSRPDTRTEYPTKNVSFRDHRSRVGNLHASSQIRLSTSEEEVEDGLTRTSSTQELYCSSLTPSTTDITRTKLLYDFGSLSRPESKSLYAINNPPVEKSSVKEEQFLSSLLPPSQAHTKSGKGILKELFLPPPPTPDISHLLSPTSSKQDLPEQTKRSSSPRRSLSRSRSTSPSAVSPKASSSAVSPKASPTQSRKKMDSAAIGRKSSEKIALEKEKLLNPKREKFCIPGMYVLVISEATQPAFLGTRLPDLFVQVRVVPQRTGRKETSVERLKSRTRLK